MIGLLRVKNEARWIERSIASIAPLCERILVMDDHSMDGTPELCSAIPDVTVLPSPFTGINEMRDKNWLLEKAQGSDYVFMIDGDEVLAPGSEDEIREVMTRGLPAASFRILYLWDSEGQIRTDGVYGRFRRPSLFRASLGHRFQSTSAGGNFHCGNVPLGLQAGAYQSNAALLHFGYLHKEDRIRKYHWYNASDPANVFEDGYRHMVQGDLPEVPVSARLRHAGPLELQPL